LHARHGIGGVGELLARAGPVDQFAVLDQDDVGRQSEIAVLTF
jgi:hypothetical protein